MSGTRCFVLACMIAGACGPTAPKVDPPGIDGGIDEMCSGDTLRCDGLTLYECRNGEFVEIDTCPNACIAPLGGCKQCYPNTGTCMGDFSHMCTGDGNGYVDVYCDPAQGLGCNIESGVCDGPCAPQYIGTSYVGCDYYPTVTATEVDNNFHFAVAVSNTSNDVAHVNVEGGTLSSPLAFSVQPGSVQVQNLPWVAALKACSSTGQLECGQTTVPAAFAPGGAYHLRSDRPVTVYQFSPLEYSLPLTGQFSYVNDASLLIPTNAMTPNYMVATWPWWDTNVDGFGQIWAQGSPGLLAVTATQDGTLVRVAPTASSNAAAGVPPFPAGVATEVIMNQGDVLELFAYGGDYTGSQVTADKPVQVIGAHYCTQVPFGVTACDHLEESMFPYETLATEYIASAPAVPALPNGKTYITRIVATEPSTTLTFDPPQGVSTFLTSTGSFVEVQTSSDFYVSADHKILVNQYMTGQDFGGGTGDPAMALAVPVQQYRLDYLFHAPTNYEVNYVNVIAPTGATVTLDGQTVTGYTPIGASGYGAVRVTLGPGIDGNHTITSVDTPFGISVYGYGQYTSYWYPGGLDLMPIPVE
jgi:hypothetical protein